VNQRLDILLPLDYKMLFQCKMGTDFIFEIYKDKRTVFSLQEIALLVNEPDFGRLKQRINYFVNRGKLKNIRRGVYAKDNYSPEELSCKIYTPSYISLDYVLQKSGVIFQYTSQITIVSYLSRILTVDGSSLRFRKIKNDILYNTSGITMHNNGINIAIPERAFLDTLYLNNEIYLDSKHSLKEDIINNLLVIYQSRKLNKMVANFFKNA